MPGVCLKVCSFYSLPFGAFRVNCQVYHFSAISSVLKRKLVILGGLSGLSRTVQEPDHAYKEITRGMKHPDTRIPKDPGNGGSDRQIDGNKGVNGKPEQ